MSWDASFSGWKRSFWSGHSTPRGVSFIASPVPTPRNTRSGYRQPSVATACATMPGW